MPNPGSNPSENGAVAMIEAVIIIVNKCRKKESGPDATLNDSEHIL